MVDSILNDLSSAGLVFGAGSACSRFLRLFLGAGLSGVGSTDKALRSHLRKYFSFVRF